MANQKGVIEIEILDDKFKQFAAVFDKFTDSIKSLPGEWAKASTATKKSDNDLLKQRREIQKLTKDFNKDLDDSTQKLKEQASLSAEIARNFASTAVSVAKWLTLGAVGSGFGLGALASSTSETRRRALGFGISTGDLRAANTSFGPLFNAESVLSRIADVKSDMGRRFILNMLGGKEGQSPAEMLPTLIQNAVSRFKQHPDQQHAEAYGLTQIFDVDELRALSNLKGSELQERIGAYGTNRSRFANSEDENKAMVDFWTALKGAGEELETSFIKALKPLAPELGKLTETVTKAITDFLKSDDVKKAIKDLTDFMGSPDGKKAIEDFFNGLAKIAELMVRITSWFGGNGTATTGNAYTDAKKRGFGFYNIKDKMAASGQFAIGVEHAGKITPLTPAGGTGTSVPERYNNPGDISSWSGFSSFPLGDGNTVAKFGNATQGMLALEKQLELYMNRDHLNTISQIMQKYLGNGNPRLESAIENVSRQSGIGRDTALSQDDIYKLMSGITKNENSKSNYTPEGIKIIIQNASGSDLNVIANSAAQ